MDNTALQKDTILKTLKEKKKLFLVILVIVLASFVYFVYGKYQTANPSNLYEIINLEKKDLVKTISVSGEIVPESEVQLASDISGQITSVYVEVGQLVKRDMLVARVENATQQAVVTQTLGALQSATAQVKSAQALLNKTINGSTQEDRDISVSQVSASESGLDLSYESARNALQNAYAGTVTAILFGTDDMIVDASGTNPTVTFNTTTSSAKIAAQNMRNTSVNIIVTRHGKKSAYAIDVNSTDNELQITRDELIILREFIDTLALAIGGAVVSSTISSSTISSYTATLNTARTQVLADIAALTNARFAIISAGKALQTTKENNNKVFASTREEDIAIAEIGVEAAKALELSASGNYHAAQSALDKTYIRSPQSGIVVDIFKEVGEFVSSSMSIAKISSESRYVSALVSEIDIAKIEIGMGVTIGLDAFPGHEFAGMVNFIYPDKQEMLGIGYYEIRVNFSKDNTQDFTILPGMALDVIIEYELKEGVVAIERSAAEKEDDLYFVKILNPNKKKPIDEKFTKKFFESGFVGDEYVEVLSGLNMDTEIVHFLAEDFGK